MSSVILMMICKILISGKVRKFCIGQFFLIISMLFSFSLYALSQPSLIPFSHDGKLKSRDKVDSLLLEAGPEIANICTILRILYISISVISNPCNITQIISPGHS
jgi:hypothetical protein